MILKRHRALKVRVLAVWQPMLVTDWLRPTTSVLHRLDDPRVVQFWDPDRRIAAAVARAGSDGDERPACCDRNGTLWDLAVVYRPSAQWDRDPPAAAWWNGPVVNVSAALEEQLLFPPITGRVSLRSDFRLWAVSHPPLMQLQDPKYQPDLGGPLVTEWK